MAAATMSGIWIFGIWIFGRSGHTIVRVGSGSGTSGSWRAGASRPGGSVGVEGSFPGTRTSAGGHFDDRHIDCREVGRVRLL